MTKVDLSKKTGISVVSIRLAETGQIVPTPSALRLYAHALGVTVAYLGCYENLPEDTLGQKITKARLYHGMTKSEFAKEIGVNVRTLYAWEADRYIPSINLDKYLSILQN